MTQFKNISLELVGGTDQGRSTQQNHELSQNCYVYVSGSVSSLAGTPGTTLFSAPTNPAIDRGFHVFNKVLYQVSGTALERADSDGTRTNLGTIPGRARCIFADDGLDMFIVTNGSVFRFNTTLTQITDSDFESPNSVAYLNRQFAYDGIADRFVISEVGDGADVRADMYAQAESDPDDLLRTYTFDQKLYLFGAETIEVWWNSGGGRPPFDRIEGSIAQKGINAIHSVSNTDSFMYFLGDDLNVYQLRGAQIRNVSNAGIEKEINEMLETSDAIGFCFNLEGFDFYYITFPTGNKSFLYSEIADEWTTMTCGVNGDRHLANSYARAYGKHLIADHATGRILEWDLNVNDEVGEVIQRRRIIPNINGELLGIPGEALLTSGVNIQMQKGLGLATGQGSDPILMVEMSFDGSQSWDTIYSLRSGEAGEFSGKVKADTMSHFYDAGMRITQSDPTPFNIRGVSMMLAKGGF